MKKYNYPQDPHEHMVKTKLRKEPKVIDENYKYLSNNIFYRLYCGFLRLLGFILFPIAGKVMLSYKVRGKRNLRKVKGGAVLVANHVHYIDTLLLSSVVSRWKKTYVVTLSTDMDIPVARHLIKGYGALPLGTTFGGSKKFNATVDSLLKNKKRILVFPEVALWPYYTEIRPFQKGAFAFAARNEVPVVPVVLTYSKTKVFKRIRLTLNICPAIYPKDMNAKQLCDLTYDNFVQAHDVITGKTNAA